MENQQPTIHRGLAIAVVMLDELVHTNEHPFCSDPDCPCKTDYDLIGEYLLTPLTAGLLTNAEAVQLYKNKQTVTLAGAYRCACPLLDVPCTNPVGAPGGLCASCANGDHRSHGRQVR